MRYNNKNGRYQDKAQLIAPYPGNAYFFYYQDNAKKMGIILIKKKMGIILLKKMGVILLKKNGRYEDKAQSIAPCPGNALLFLSG